MTRSDEMVVSDAEALFARLMNHNGDPFGIMMGDTDSRLHHARMLLLRYIEEQDPNVETSLALLLESLIEDGCEGAVELRAIATLSRGSMAKPRATRVAHPFSTELPRVARDGHSNRLVLGNRVFRRDGRNVIPIDTHRAYRPSRVVDR